MNAKSEEIRPMSATRRRLMLQINDGYAPGHEVSTRLYFLDCHFPPALLDPALRFLIRNGLTGRRFYEWVKGECGGSNLEMQRKLLEWVKGKEVPKLFAGKDVLLA